MVTVIEAAVLGALQGLTEFLPVSSSGHLVLGQYLMGLPHNLSFDIAVHFGTLLAIIVALGKDVRTVLTGLVPGSGKQGAAGRRLILLLIVGTVPAGLVGYLFSDAIEELFQSVIVTGIMLVVTGTLLYFADKAASGKITMPKMKYADALFVGIGQALAVIPGLSRSGTTLSAGLARGIVRDDAARFSFLLAIPVILGAAVLALPDILSGAAGLDWQAIATGLVVSAVAGYMAIRLLLVVVQGRLVVFSYYTWLVGLGAIIYGLIGR